MIVISNEEKERREEQSNNVKQEYLRAKDLAVMMGIGLSSVWRLRKLGVFTSYKIGQKTTVFKRDEVEAYLESCRVTEEVAS